MYHFILLVLSVLATASRVALGSVLSVHTNFSDISNPFWTYKINIPTSFKRALGYPEDALRNFTQIVQNHGYTNEEHSVTTEDGYILSVFRMHSSNCSTFKSLPVILNHGVFVSSESWLDAGPEAGLAYLLAGSCYDLWITNCRGGVYSRKHTTLNPDADADFWHYSVDEIGYYDLPAIIDYVLEQSGAEKVNFIGHSQGMGSLMITLSERPEYNDDINLAVGLNPAVNFSNMKSVPSRLLFKLYLLLKDVFADIGLQETLFKGNLLQTTFEFLCHDLTLTRGLCIGFLKSIDSYVEGSFTDETWTLIYSHFFTGHSVQQLVKYGQVFDYQDFVKYDYGEEENLERYGSTKPPAFPLDKVTAPVAIIAGASDNLIVPQDIQWVVDRLPNVVENVNVSNSDWNHIDSLYSKNIPTLLYPLVEDYLTKY